MISILAIMLAVSPSIYAAKLPTFGCTSDAEVAALQRLRDDAKAFQTELYQQFFNGECVQIAKDEVVEGAIDETNPSLLQVDKRIMPPGYLAPLADFQAKTAEAGAAKQDAPAPANEKPASDAK